MPWLMGSLAAAGLAITLSVQSPVVAQPEPVKVQPQPAQPNRIGRPGPGERFREGQPGQPGRPSAGAPEFRNLGQAMKVMNRGLKFTITNLEVADQRARLLETLSQMQRAAIFCKDATLDEIPAGKDKESVQAEYRRHGVRNAIMLLDLELQVLQGKIDDAKATIKKIEDYRDKSHEEFQVEDEGDEDGKAAEEDKKERDEEAKRDGGR